MMRRDTRLLISALIPAALTLTGPARAEVHEVTTSGNLFVPQHIVVAPGDTVRWTWGGGDHTVTSGANCTFDGLYFNEPLDGANPVFQWVVPDIEGVLDYYCIFHCDLFNMTGTITVEPVDCPWDLDRSGAVGTSDLLDLLAAWGTDPGGPPDFDGSGDVGTSDLLELLANWGSCP